MLVILFEIVKKVFNKRSEYFRQITPILLSVSIIIIVECVYDFSLILSKYEKNEYASLYISVPDSSELQLNYAELDSVLGNFENCTKQVDDVCFEGITVSTLKEQKVVIHSANRGYFLNMENDLSTGRFFSEADEEYCLPVAIIPNNIFAGANDSVGNSIKVRTDDNKEFEFEIIGTYSAVSPVDEEYDIYVNYSYLFNQGIIKDNYYWSISYLIPYDNANMITDYVRKYYDVNYPEANIKVTADEEVQSSNDITIKVVLIIVEFFLFIAFIMGNMGILTMSLIEVNKRSKEFGIKRAIGVKKSSIILEITAENIFLSLIGTIFGSIIGMFIGNFINFAIVSKYNMGFFDFVYPLKMIAANFVVALGVNFIFSLIPVRKILRMNIVDAIRCKE